MKRRDFCFKFGKKKTCDVDGEMVNDKFRWGGQLHPIDPHVKVQYLDTPEGEYEGCALTAYQRYISKSPIRGELLENEYYDDTDDSTLYHDVLKQKFNLPELKAKKHIDISLKIEDIVKEIKHDLDTYVGTYTAGNSGQIYQRIEEDSNRTFYSLALFIDGEHSRGSHKKDPDVIVVDPRYGKVILVIEVKWAWIPNAPPNIKRDIFDIFEGEEYGNFISGVKYGTSVDVNGPACVDRIRKRHASFTLRTSFKITKRTKFLVVTDIHSLFERSSGDYSRLSKYIEQNREYFETLDIDRSVNGIMDLRSYLQRL